MFFGWLIEVLVYRGVMLYIYLIDMYLVLIFLGDYILNEKSWY